MYFQVYVYIVFIPYETTIPILDVQLIKPINMSVLPNLTYGFGAIPIKITASYFMENDQMFLKFIWRSKRPRTVNTILKKREVRGLMLPNFKTYYKTAEIKTAWYWNHLISVQTCVWADPTVECVF